VRQALPHAAMRFIATARHSPHTEEDAWQECNASASEFFKTTLEPDAPGAQASG
jgi:hypothetical protein